MDEFFQQLLGAGSLLGGGLLTNEAYDRLGDIGDDAYTRGMDIAADTSAMSSFQPFGVTSSLGNVQTDAQGGFDVNLSPQQQALVDQLGAGASGMYGQAMTGPTAFDYDALAQQAQGLGSDFMNRSAMGIADRQGAIYDQIRATQRPEEERQRLALESRLAGQGRLGVSTAAYGGTPEQLALAKAQEEAQNSAFAQARGMASQEQLQQANIGTNYQNLGMSAPAQQIAAQAGLAGIGSQMMQGQYLPYAQQLNMLGQGTQLANIANTNQRQAAGLFGEAAMSGIEAQLGAGLGQANLIGNLGTGLLTGALTPIATGDGGIFSSILGTIQAPTTT